ncbi:MAG: hypothetical protein LUG83_02130, partial [Lachnospiraceae bacterium]|nr:hypothetical protein [Lachnospiraceae bacterium]
MKKYTNHYKRIKYTYIKSTIVTLFVCLLFVKGYTLIEETGENYFHISINGEEVGVTDDAGHVNELTAAARRNIAALSDDLTFIDADIDIVGEEVLWGRIDDDDTLIASIQSALSENIIETMQHGYSMKVNEYMV